MAILLTWMVHLGRSAQSVNDVSNNIDKSIKVDVCLMGRKTYLQLEHLIYLVS